MQEVLPLQQFVTAIQAKAEGILQQLNILKPTGRTIEPIKAYRKDVLTKLGKTVGGGDVTRKKKLLEKQKRGKKKQQTVWCTRRGCKNT
jgi:GTP-binding protein LepA